MEKQQIKELLKIDYTNALPLAIVLSVLGILLYFLSAMVELPSFTLFGFLTFQIELSIVVLVIFSFIGGPIVGLSVGVVGSLIVDILLYNQIIAIGMIYVLLGGLGFLIGLPRYKEEQFGSKFVNALLVSIGCYVLLLMGTIGILVLVNNQPILGTILYNIIPTFSVLFLSLVIYGTLIGYMVNYYFQKKVLSQLIEK